MMIASRSSEVERRLEQRGVDVISLRFDVKEHWHQAVLDDWVHRRWKARGHRDHFVAGLQLPFTQESVKSTPR